MKESTIRTKLQAYIDNKITISKLDSWITKQNDKTQNKRTNQLLTNSKRIISKFLNTNIPAHGRAVRIASISIQDSGLYKDLERYAKSEIENLLYNGILKCRSRIVREHKRSKADCIWPENMNGITDNIDKYPETCNGDVTITVKLKNEPDWGGTYAALRIEPECSRCKHPYFEGALDIHSAGDELLTKALTYYLMERNKRI